MAQKSKPQFRVKKRRHAIYSPEGTFIRKIKPMKRWRKTRGGGLSQKTKGGHRFHRMKSNK